MINCNKGIGTFQDNYTYWSMKDTQVAKIQTCPEWRDIPNNYLERLLTCPLVQIYCMVNESFGHENDATKLWCKEKQLLGYLRNCFDFSNKSKPMRCEMPFPISLASSIQAKKVILWVVLHLQFCTDFLPCKHLGLRKLLFVSQTNWPGFSPKRADSHIKGRGCSSCLSGVKNMVCYFFGCSASKGKQQGLL